MEPSRETGEQLGGKLQKELLTKTTEKKTTGLTGYKNCIRRTEVLCCTLIRDLTPFLSFSWWLKLTKASELWHRFPLHFTIITQNKSTERESQQRFTPTTLDITLPNDVPNLVLPSWRDGALPSGNLSRSRFVRQWFLCSCWKLY